MNKNLIIKLVATVSIASCVALCGCTGSQEPPERTGNNASEIASKPDEAHYVFIESTPKAPSRTTKAEDGTVYKSMTIEKLNITQKARVDKPKAEKMQQVIASAYDRHESMYQAEQDVIFEQLEAGTLDMSNIPYETKVSYQELRNDGRAISIGETIEAYSAGNPTSTTRFNYNFDPLTGAHITTDVFYMPGDKASLDAAENTMLGKITAKYGEGIVDYSLISASLIDTAQDTWYFTQDGVVVTFRAGEIADASIGEITIEYTKSELPEFSQKYFA